MNVLVTGFNKAGLSGVPVNVVVAKVPDQISVAEGPIFGRSAPTISGANTITTFGAINEYLQVPFAQRCTLRWRCSS